jgi:restriction system protein
MPPYDFQELVAALLQGMNYHVEWISPPGRDGGVDIIAHGDPLGINGPQIKVQVKRREAKVTVDGLRAFMGLLSESDVGIFFSTGGFTKEAEEEARRQQLRRVRLVNSDQFLELWIRFYDHVPEVRRRLLPLRPVYYLAPLNPEKET